jgi:zinc/manganese transport system substrate-binding protein
MRVLGVLAVSGLVLAGCGGATSSDETAAGAGPTIVATTTMLGDVASQVASCAGGSASTLMPVGADPHDFAPSSEQVAELVEADLVVANGLALEQGLSAPLDAARDDGATVLEVADLVDPLEFDGHAGEEHAEDEHAGEEHAEDEHAGEEHAEDEHAGHEHGSYDPHVWHDAARMAAVAEIIGDTLAESTGDQAFSACGQQVRDSLLETDEQVRTILADVPDDQRVLVTDHDAFEYFAQAYDFEIAGVVIPGGSTLAEPSSDELANLVEVIQSKGVPAIVTDVAEPDALADAVAAEVGDDVALVELYVGSLGPSGSGADTYAGMMVTNAQRIADALAG